VDEQDFQILTEITSVETTPSAIAFEISGASSKATVTEGGVNLRA